MIILQLTYTIDGIVMLRRNHDVRHVYHCNSFNDGYIEKAAMMGQTEFYFFANVFLRATM